MPIGEGDLLNARGGDRREDVDLFGPGIPYSQL